MKQPMKLILSGLFLVVPIMCWSQTQLEESLLQARETLRKVVTTGDTDNYLLQVSDILEKQNVSQADLASFSRNPALDPFSVQLLNTWKARLEFPRIFEKMAPFSEPAKLGATQMLSLQGRQRVAVPRIVALKTIPLELLHPLVQKTVNQHEETYLSLLNLGQEVRAEAQNLLDQGSKSFQSLSDRYQNQLRQLSADFGDSYEQSQAWIQILGAAQLPAFGIIVPPKPLLDPQYLPLWEEILLCTPDVTYKRKLISLLSESQTNSLNFCLGIVLEQIIHSIQAGKNEDEKHWLIYQVFDFYRDHPSLHAAIALDNAMGYNGSFNTPINLPIGKRLDSTGWQTVLEKMAQVPEHRSMLNRLRKSDQRRR